MNTSDMSFENDLVLDGWYVRDEMGCGSNGITYSVTDAYGNSAVIKFPFSMNDDPNSILDSKTSIRNEINMLSYLNSRQSDLKVPTILDCGYYEGHPFYVMTKFGKSVDQLWREAKFHFTNLAILKITLCVVKTLKDLHSFEVTHGDIQGKNIVSAGPEQDDNAVFLISFGQCRSLKEESQMRDVANALNLMGRLLSNGRKALLSQMDFVITEWTEPTVDRKELVRQNLEETYRIRSSEGNPEQEPKLQSYNISLGKRDRMELYI
ncbi:Protein kinase [Gracilaria domingensis]|nr:Protein kinase [Gracilaria domingensis]